MELQVRWLWRVSKGRGEKGRKGEGSADGESRGGKSSSESESLGSPRPAPRLLVVVCPLFLLSFLVALTCVRWLVGRGGGRWRLRAAGCAPERKRPSKRERAAPERQLPAAAPAPSNTTREQSQEQAEANENQSGHLKRAQERSAATAAVDEREQLASWQRALRIV